MSTRGPATERGEEHAARSVPSLAAEDVALLERVAGRIVELHLAAPALLALETARPLSVLAGQALVFFQPFAQALFALPDYDRFARLLERRDALSLLIERIEERAIVARSARPARTPEAR